MQSPALQNIFKFCIFLCNFSIMLPFFNIFFAFFFFFLLFFCKIAHMPLLSRIGPDNAWILSFIIRRRLIGQTGNCSFFCFVCHFKISLSLSPTFYQNYNIPKNFNPPPILCWFAGHTTFVGLTVLVRRVLWVLVCLSFFPSVCLSW